MQSVIKIYKPLEHQKIRQQNLCLQNLKKNVRATSISFREFKDWRANSVDPDEAAHYELPHLDLHCLQTQLFFSVLYELK